MTSRQPVSAKNPKAAARAKRIEEAIDTSGVRMSRIADRLDVARTSVLNWKRHGGIQAEHIKGLAEITGFNFWWLAFGEGPKLGNDNDALESTIQKMIEASPDHAELLRRQAQMTASGVLTRKFAKALTSTLEAIPVKEPD